MPWRLAILFAGLHAALVPAFAQAEVHLRPEAWDGFVSQGASCAWDAETLTLAAPEGTAASVALRTRETIGRDFDAEVHFTLLEWPGGLGAGLAATFGVVEEAEADGGAGLIGVSREWEGPLDQFRAVQLVGPVRRYPASVLAGQTEGILRIVRRGSYVQAVCADGAVVDTLQQFSLVKGGSLRLYLGFTNALEGAVVQPATRVRFHHFKLTYLPSGGRPGPPPGEADPDDWVIWSSGVGWLRVGRRGDVARPWKMRDEIHGGQSEDPLPKTILREGFASRAEALDFLCDRLSRVRMLYSPLAAPYDVVEAMFDGQPYRLQLEGGLTQDDFLPKAMEYQVDAEKAILKEHGITPRRGFGRQWLIHITGHGTLEGVVKEDEWILFSAEPAEDPAWQPKGRFWMPDGYGGTFTYTCDEWEGPYRDNFGLARALRRRGVAKVKLWPPGNQYTPEVVAAEVPDNARDHGAEVLGVQPIVDPPELRDWVVYMTAGQWLHIGTRIELQTPVKARDTIWSGTGEEAVKKEPIYFGRRFVAYEQALDAVLGKLQEVVIGYHPNAEPRETVKAKLNGKDVLCHLARSPHAAVVGYGGYDLGAEIRLMLDHQIVPVKRFGQQWMVHATGHGTYNGPVKDDFWMMVTSEPKDGGVTIPDGTGGTFGYSVDQVEGPFTDSLGLARALQKRGLKGINLAGGYQGVSVNDAIVARPKKPPAPTRIVSVTPDRGEAGQTFYVTVIAEGMRPWYGFQFGQGVLVTDPTCLGANPDGPGERWLATISIADNARFNAGR
ncbi:MAG: hypothetical protein HYU66_22455 [Armatimonadetes bacterium]|nr:hypothetical protein [Armatimonadota bacterium]